MDFAVPSGQCQRSVTVQLPGSKSMTNRALVLAALAQGQSTLCGVLEADDSCAMVDSLRALGVNLSWDLKQKVITVEGLSGPYFKPKATVNCRESGTVSRFLLAACAGAQGQFDFVGQGRLTQRPMKHLLDVLAQQGCGIEYQAEVGQLPLRMQAHGLMGGQMTIPGTISSQYCSGLSMILPYAKQDSELTLQPTMRRPYVEMTWAMMAQFGVDVQSTAPHVYRVPQGHYRACQVNIEADASTASYFAAAALLMNSEVTIGPVQATSLQGDWQFLECLANMGAKVLRHKDTITVRGVANYQGGTFDMREYSDTFMSLAILAPFAQSKTVITGLKHTQFQESNRVSAMAHALSGLGVEVMYDDDQLTLYPSCCHGARVSCSHDHRLAMSLAILGLRVPGVVIEGFEAVSKTCPQFADMLQSF